MTNKVTSADGTLIAYDLLCSGPPVVVVGGATCDRAKMAGITSSLSSRFTVVNYDRRGRGQSGDTSPYSVLREVEDLAALLANVGGGVRHAGRAFASAGGGGARGGANGPGSGTGRVLHGGEVMRFDGTAWQERRSPFTVDEAVTVAR